MIVLSFCIPVFNQLELVRSCIDSIIEYKKDDIEIIINDDCSNENIESLVMGYGDNRIKYYKNKENLGHDRNIIASFKHAQGKFAFLLRTRDKIIASAIPILIDKINSDDNIAYITASAIDERNKIVFQYEEKIYKKGVEALRAHMNLYIHPSGSAYRLKNLKLDQMEQFLVTNIEPKYSFVVHNLLRVQLSQEGDFSTIKIPSWIYTNTSRANDVAVNSTKVNKSVYSSEYSNQRYYCEMIWSSEILNGNLRLEMYQFLFKMYLNQATWIYKLSNCSRELQYHYNFEPERISVKKERNKFIDLTSAIGNRIFTEEEKKKFKQTTRYEILYNTTIGAVKYFALQNSERIKPLKILFEINKIRYSKRLK